MHENGTSFRWEISSQWKLEEFCDFLFSLFSVDWTDYDDTDNKLMGSWYEAMEPLFAWRTDNSEINSLFQFDCNQSVHVAAKISFIRMSSLSANHHICSLEATHVLAHKNHWK